MVYEDILIEPVLTEKATALREEGKYVFKVSPEANKYEIKEAVRRLFGVKVAKCTVLVELPVGKRQSFGLNRAKQLRCSRASKPATAFKKGNLNGS